MRVNIIEKEVGRVGLVRLVGRNNKGVMKMQTLVKVKSAIGKEAAMLVLVGFCAGILGGICLGIMIALIPGFVGQV